MITTTLIIFMQYWLENVSRIWVNLLNIMSWMLKEIMKKYVMKEKLFKWNKLRTKE